MNQSVCRHHPAREHFLIISGVLDTVKCILALFPSHCASWFLNLFSSLEIWFFSLSLIFTENAILSFSPSSTVAFCAFPIAVSSSSRIILRIFDALFSAISADLRLVLECPPLLMSLRIERLRDFSDAFMHDRIDHVVFMVCKNSLPRNIKNCLSYPTI